MNESASLRILVADDDQQVREFFRQMLTRLNHQAFLATGGRELVERARELNPDLIITDIVMPDLDGIEAATEITQDKSIPIILVSGHEDPDLVNRLGSDHIMNYLVKPVCEAEVRVAINIAMRRFQQYQAVCQEASNLRQALENRKLLERAKGAVMRRLGVDEPEALRRMKKLASYHNRKLTDIAEEVIQAEQIFYRLEQI